MNYNLHRGTVFLWKYMTRHAGTIIHFHGFCVNVEWNIHSIWQVQKHRLCRCTFLSQVYIQNEKSPSVISRHVSWRRLHMESSSVLMALCAGNPHVTGEFPSQRPMTRSFDVFFDLRLDNNRDSGDLGHHRAHYKVAVMHFSKNHMTSTGCVLDEI